MNLYNDDCFNIFPEIKDKSVDLILCDLPYGTTKCKWDSILPLEQLWKEYNRIINPEVGNIVLFSSQPFTSILINSNISIFKYCLVWEKSKATGYLNAKKNPMKAHEDICIFYKKHKVFNPQMTISTPYNKGKALRETQVYGKQKEVLVENTSGLRYPRSVLYYKTAESEGTSLHPTQKPVALCEYLIKTYSNPGDLVLDNCMGSGTTGVACFNTNRQFIGIEKEKEYYNMAEKRLEEEKNKYKTRILRYYHKNEKRFIYVKVFYKKEPFVFANVVKSFSKFLDEKLGPGLYDEVIEHGNSILDKPDILFPEEEWLFDE